MATHFAALLFRSDAVPDRALSQGFAVALAGWDVPAPRLDIAPLPGLPGWSAAFYSSGAKLPRGAEGEELDHAAEVFEDDLPPAVGVLDAAAELGHHGAVVYAIVFADDVLLDDAWRFDAEGAVRRFVREGDEGIEAGVVSAEDARVEVLDIDDPEDEGAIRPRRGSTFLSQEFGAPALPSLVGALFATERRIAVRLVEPGAEAIAGEARRLVRALRRVEGRGAFEPPAAVAWVATPDAYRAFVRAYDWADPADPGDSFRGLAIGAVEGTLRFLREDELRALGADPAWASAAKAGLFPVARLSASALGGGAMPKAILALAADGEDLALVRGGATRDIVVAGPTFGEMLRYLALGWSKRNDAEEDMITALMLRAKIRSSGG